MFKNWKLLFTHFWEKWEDNCVNTALENRHNSLSYPLLMETQVTFLSKINISPFIQVLSLQTLNFQIPTLIKFILVEELYFFISWMTVKLHEGGFDLLYKTGSLASEEPEGSLSSRH